MGKSKSKPGKSAVPAKKQKIDDSDSERCSSDDGLLLDAQTTRRETPPSVQDDNSSSAESDSDETESSEEDAGNIGTKTGLVVPKINPEIRLKLPKHSKTRDSFIEKRQEWLRQAMSGLGWAMTTLINEPQDMDKCFFMECLYEVGLLISEAMNRQTESRIACIKAGLDVEKCTILADMTPGEFLFGDNLSEKFKAANAMNCVAEAIRKGSESKQVQPKQALNSFGQQKRRSFFSQAASSESRQKSQNRPRIPFRGKQPFFHQQPNAFYQQPNFQQMNYQAPNFQQLMKPYQQNQKKNLAEK
ncbi:hypothetical protein QAD02_005065 [Eretmocerus hayati]|uniref:Uncharacterized protein n=1 Tax=Eretmocerus hayati TaxID=131215 RepID=A0ACC2NSK8_9HYME|nr:hypothetical protein QAD02_005065 [Eretmocerus hayati]